MKRRISPDGKLLPAENRISARRTAGKPYKTAEGERRYAVGGVKPEGIPERRTRCVASVFSYECSLYFQCQRLRGYGPNKEYCKIHAAKLPENSEDML